MMINKSGLIRGRKNEIPISAIESFKIAYRLWKFKQWPLATATLNFYVA